MRFLVIIILLLLAGCSRHDVGSETNNPAPTSSLTLSQAQNNPLVIEWVKDSTHRWSTPSPTSSMVPYMDSHSVLLLESVTGPVRLHDILVVNEGVGRENICHQIVDIKGTYLYIEGKNNTWPDGWVPLASAKWRVAGILYSKG